MKILVIGAGAVGGWIGGHIGRSGHWVTLVGRSSFVDAVRANGLRIEYASGQSWTTRNVTAATSVSEALGARDGFGPPYDAILVCVKAYDVEGVVSELRATESSWCRAGEDGRPCTRIVTFQNGVGAEERVAEAFGAERVIAATLTSPVSMPAPGVVRLGRAGGGIGLAPCDGPLPDLSRSAVAAALKQSHPDPIVLLHDTLKQSLLRVETYGDYRSMKWSKLYLNVVSNATSAILGMTPAQVYADTRLFGLEMRMLREALAVTQAARIPLIDLPGVPAAWLARLVRRLPDLVLRPLLSRSIARGRGDKLPSFYYDVARDSVGQVSNLPGHEVAQREMRQVTNLSHRRSEVSWLNGAVVQLGRRVGIATPVNATLAEVLTDLVEGRVSADQWKGNVDQLVDRCCND